MVCFRYLDPACQKINTALRCYIECTLCQNMIYASIDDTVDDFETYKKKLKKWTVESQKIRTAIRYQVQAKENLCSLMGANLFDKKSNDNKFASNLYTVTQQQRLLTNTTPPRVYESDEISSVPPPTMDNYNLSSTRFEEVRRNNTVQEEFEKMLNEYASHNTISSGNTFIQFSVFSSYWSYATCTLALSYTPLLI